MNVSRRIRSGPGIALGAAVAILTAVTTFAGCATATNQRCPVHQRALLRGSMRIEYGLPRPLPRLDAARAKAFPHANSTLTGRCNVTDRTHEPTVYCPDCRAAERAWLRDNPDPETW